MKHPSPNINRNAEKIIVKNNILSWVALPRNKFFIIMPHNQFLLCCCYLKIKSYLNACKHLGRCVHLELLLTFPVFFE